MSSRYLPVLLLSAALAFACGPRSRVGESASRQKNKGTPAQPVAAAFDVRVDDGVVFALHVTNQARKSLELTFPDGQTHDIVVTDTLGRTVWRWSEGRLFTQTLRNHVLDERETMSYEGAWSPGDAHGTFIAVASLRSQNHPVEKRVQFTLP